MSYFDHIKCSACRAQINPDSLGGSRGEPMKCPACGAQLSMQDLFGVADAFTGFGEDGNRLSLDDAVEGYGEFGTYDELLDGPRGGAAEPEPPRKAAGASRAPQRGAPQPAARGGKPQPQSRGLPGPASAGQALVKRAGGAKPAESGGQSASDVLKSLKKGR